MKRCELNEGDIIEMYNVNTNASHSKYVITKKIVTKYRGNFYDLATIPEDDEMPSILFGRTLNAKTDTIFKYRIYVHGKK